MNGWMDTKLKGAFCDIRKCLKKLDNYARVYNTSPFNTVHNKILGRNLTWNTF